MGYFAETSNLALAITTRKSKNGAIECRIVSATPIPTGRPMSTHALTTRETFEPMATEWYYRIMNDEIGPLSSRQLLEKVRTGQIKHDTPIRKDDSQWVVASQVSGLLDAVDKTATRHLCPYCGHVIDRPPTTCPGCNRKLVVSMNSRLTQAGMSKVNRTRKTRQEQAEQLRERSEQRDLVKYIGLLALWFVLLILTPYVIYFASHGQLVFQGRLAVISVAIVSALVGALYVFISRVL